MTGVAGFCLHFYQPPREDPWLGVVPLEWSAWPYHDWNERITAECYRAMIAVALPKEGGGQVELVEPLPGSVYDVGPTLHGWLERAAPDVDLALVHQARAAPGGASAVAMAAPLVHAILPLARPEDRARLVAWGVADYVRRFDAAPRGMWLPETAVDLATLEALCDEGITFTVLMPTQAARVREFGGEWREVDAATLDTSRAYVVRLGGGRTITVVFGHHELSQRVAFGDLLRDGTALADAMASALAGSEGVVLLVADGETYGHHHRFGDLGLAWALRRLRAHYGLATALGPWLEGATPTREVQLAAVSSWSCAHGVERWRSDCGCATGGEAGWRQAWRAPLRASLDWLRERLGAEVDHALADRVDSVDDTLREYGAVLAGSRDGPDFVAAHATRALDDVEVVRVLELCEIHRHLLLAFTSCAWFFADPDEIETMIVLRHAAVALDIAAGALGLELEVEFLRRLARVRSNRPGIDGAEIYRRARGARRFDEPSLAAGFAVEHVAGVPRDVRGDWRAEVSVVRPGVLGVAVTHVRTRRRRAFRIRVEAPDDVTSLVAVEDGEREWLFRLGELGDDVVARVVAARLAGPGVADPESALDLLVSWVLTHPATPDAASATVAMASALRCATPSAEAAIRRALLSLRDRRVGPLERGAWDQLAEAVGLGRAMAPRDAPGVG